MQNTDSLFLDHRLRTLRAFANCIEECHRLGPGKWGITVVSPRHVRLIFGSLIVASVESGLLWLAVPPDQDKLLDDCMTWRWTPKWHYKRPPSRSGLYLPWLEYKAIWPEIRKRHFAFLAQVGDIYSVLRGPSKKAHSDEFLDLLEESIGRELPRPRY